jgi:hypothetical protein
MRSVPPDDAMLLERLRAEAARDRQAFDGVVHGRILAAVQRRVGGSAGSGVAGPWRLVASAALLGLVCAAVAWRGAIGPTTVVSPGDTVAATPAAPGMAIDALPSFDELGEGVAGGIGSLAASVVGIPEWRELAVADLPLVAQWGLDAAGGGREGPAGLGAPR